MIHLGYILSNINNLSIHNIIMSDSPNSPMTAAARRYNEDPSDLEALREMIREDMNKHAKAIKNKITEMESAKPKDKKKIAELKKMLKKAEKAGILGGKRTSRKRKSRKSKKGKTAKKRRH